jgi:hypothetical protein
MVENLRNLKMFSNNCRNTYMLLSCYYSFRLLNILSACYNIILYIYLLYDSIGTATRSVRSTPRDRLLLFKPLYLLLIIRIRYVNTAYTYLLPPYNTISYNTHCTYLRFPLFLPYNIIIITLWTIYTIYHILLYISTLQYQTVQGVCHRRKHHNKIE